MEPQLERRTRHDAKGWYVTWKSFQTAYLHPNPRLTVFRLPKALLSEPSWGSKSGVFATLPEPWKVSDTHPRGRKDDPQCPFPFSSSGFQFFSRSNLYGPNEFITVVHHGLIFKSVSIIMSVLSSSILRCRPSPESLVTHEEESQYYYVSILNNSERTRHRKVHEK